MFLGGYRTVELSFGMISLWSLPCSRDFRYLTDGEHHSIRRHGGDVFQQNRKFMYLWCSTATAPWSAARIAQIRQSVVRIVSRTAGVGSAVTDHSKPPTRIDNELQQKP